MAEHPNVERLRDAYTAFAKGDLAAFDELWTDDITWHIPGRSQLAGTYEGRPAIFELFGRLIELTDGTFRAEPRALVADDEWGFAVVGLSAHRGARSLETMDVHTVRLVDGRMAEFWTTSTDPYATDEFWG